MGHSTMKAKVTSIDVAKLLGVSQSTVSRAFSSTASISDKKRKMVMEAADKLGYTPNAIARSLISNRSGLIAIAIDSNLNPFYTMLSTALAIKIQSIGGQAIMCPTDGDNLDLAISRAIEYQADGLIIPSGRLNSGDLAQCEKYGMHLSVMNRYVNGVNANSIGLDNYRAGQDAAHYLLGKGHTRFAYVRSEKGNMASDNRWAGFAKEVVNAGHSAPIIIQADFTFDAGLQAAEELLAIDASIDAVFCASDIIAMGVMDGLRQAGFQIPRDFAVMGVDDIPMSVWPSYDLTTIKHPIKAIVETAVNDLMGRIKTGANAESKYISIRGELISRSSA